VANLVEVLDPLYGLQKDEWSEEEKTFGDEGQICVIGWSGRYRKNKYYILSCSKCANDPELHGEGYFKILKAGIIRGRLVCGCSNRKMYMKWQYEVLCKRKAEEIGCTFTDFADNWEGRRDKVLLKCKKHSYTGSVSVDNLLRQGWRCPSCKKEVIGDATRQSDDEMIKDFFGTGAFHPNTVFKRSDTVCPRGWKIFWRVWCPECDEDGEAPAGNLKLGQRPCGCSKNRQTQAYINTIRADEITIHLKFGIANSTERRVAQLDRACIYNVQNLGVWEFESSGPCKAAERECKQTLECGVLTKEEMPDGYTESTWLYNLYKIISIYEKHGGKRIK